MTRENMREIRQRMGMGVQDFAPLIGVHYSTLVGWEQGNSRPNAMQMTIYRELERKLQAETKQADTIRNTLIGVGIVGFLFWLFNEGKK